MGNSSIQTKRLGSLAWLFRVRVWSILACVLLVASAPEALAKPTRSTNIALHDNGSVLVNANLEANSATIFVVLATGNITKRAEVPVGREPHCVAIHAARNEAFVTNSASGTVSVIALAGANANRVVATITLAGGAGEPRACALTPNGQTLYVANHSAGTVSVINPATRAVTGTIAVGGNPGAIAITDNPGEVERVFVTQFFARLRSGAAGREGFDDGKEGLVRSFLTNAPGTIVNIPLSPLANSGFNANRAAFCNLTAEPDPVNQTFCPNTSISDPANPAIAQDPQAVFPNQLFSALVCGNRLFLPNIGAQPEPPVLFNANVQALVHVVNAGSSPPVQIASQHVNLNNQIKTETPPADPSTSLKRLFGNDVVAIDSSPDCQNFFIVSRGGNFVLKARPNGPNGSLSIGAPNNVVRFRTGNIPTGIAVNSAGTRAYVNNEVNTSVSVLNLQNNSVVALNADSSTPPVPGTFEHSRLMGKLVFFTALGTPDNGLTEIPIRGINPLADRGKQSDNAWSTCASCHPGGLADGVTWIFADGPRQTIPLDGLFSKINGSDTRINNWSAVRDSVTDFNNNSRNVQCGAGFAGGDPPVACNPASAGGAPDPRIYDHGISQGASDALDMETQWVKTVRPLNVPKAAAGVSIQGAIVFQNFCVSCHGGAKWTKSQVIYSNNPALDKAFAAGGVARDSGVTITGNQIVSYTDALLDPNPLSFLDNVGTFNTASPIEIRANGSASNGALGFNSPSLLGVRNNGPYFHDGSAQTINAVLQRHTLTGGATIFATLSASQRTNLTVFLNSLDGKNPIFQSDTDVFRNPGEDL